MAFQWLQTDWASPIVFVFFMAFEGMTATGLLPDVRHALGVSFLRVLLVGGAIWLIAGIAFFVRSLVFLIQLTQPEYTLNETN